MTREDAREWLAEHEILEVSDIQSFEVLIDIVFDFAQDSQEIYSVKCVRCDREFRSLESVKYCSQDCEEGRVKMPYQDTKKVSA
jgi:hypothetical protein